MKNPQPENTPAFAGLREIAAILQNPPAEDFDCEKLRATNKDLEGVQLPFQLYEVVTRSVGDKLTGVDILPIQVTRFGIAPGTGATLPSIDFTDAAGRKAMGSVGMFYLTMEAALQEANYIKVSDRYETAKEALSSAHQSLIALLKSYDEASSKAALLPQTLSAMDGMWKFAGQLVETHGMSGDDTLTDAQHAQWQEVSSACNWAMVASKSTGTQG